MSMSHESTVNGFANDLYTFTFPEFDPTVGTLTDVNVRATVNRIYGYELENRGTQTINNHRIIITNWDYINSPALPGTLEYENEVRYGPHVLAPSDGIPDAGSDYFKRTPGYLMNGVIYQATVYNTADFMGSGHVAFSYETSTGTTFTGNVATVDYKNGILEEQITFRITYNYYSSILLAADITSFTAGKKGDGTIDIKWLTKNEKTNRKYELQKSTDGRVYRSVTEFAAQAGTTTGAYSYSYQAQPNENNTVLHFRLKMVDEGGSTKFSATRSVKLTSAASTQPILYPNPTKGTTTLTFNDKNRGNWEVEILTISGQVIKRYFFNNAQLAKLNTANELQRGLYLVRSTNKTTQEQFVQRLLIQ
jgi:hypothetical protein